MTPQARANYQNSRSGKLGALSRITGEEIVAALLQQQHKCTYCGSDIKERWQVDHIIPLSRGGLNVNENIQMLCRVCNSSKGAKSALLEDETMTQANNITGAEFKMHRSALGLTQQQMADAIGVKKITVQKYEGDPSRVLPGYVTKLIRLVRIEVGIAKRLQ